MAYKWTITKDLVEYGNDVGVINFHPRQNKTLADIEVSSKGASQMSKLSRSQWSYVRWRAYCGDNKLMYEGKMIMSPGADGFEPLDDFCRPNAGAAFIKIFENNAWKWL